MKHIKTINKLALATLALGLMVNSKSALAATPYVMANGNYLQDFADIANWQNDFAGGIGASNWQSVAINSSGTIPDGVKTTKNSATFVSSTAGGVQKGTQALVFLSTGNDNANAVAVDLLLDFTGRNAGTLTFDWAEVDNPSGNKAGALKVYTSTDGTTFTELTDAFVTVTNAVAASGTISGIVLPVSFNGSSTAQIRFYEYSSPGGGTSGNRPKISIDNVAVTSTSPSGEAPNITGISPSSIAANAGDTATITVTSTGDAPTYFWYKETATETNLISGATTATLTLANVLAADAANYQVVLTNASGAATSDVVTVSVADPYIAVQPTSQTRLLGGSIAFTVSALGTETLGYQWYVKPGADDFDFTGATPLSDGGTLSGAADSTLTITNLTAADATNYFVVVTNGLGNAATSSVVTLTVSATQAPLAFWNFNGNLNVTNPAVAQGVGTALAVNCTTFSNFNASALDPGPGSPNNGWGSDSYPTNGNVANNKTAGVRFNVSTLGAKNIAVSYDTRITSTASKYTRLQYTTNGTDFIDYPVSAIPQSANYDSHAFSLAGFPGVANNTNFAVRIVTEFESTAWYGATNDDQYVGNGGSYSTSGTISYDIVSITGDAITNNNTPPTVSAFTNVVMGDTGGSTVLHFTVGDAETAAGDLQISVASSNQMVMPDYYLTLGGSGANRTLTLTSTPGALGVAPILVTVTDGDGDVTTTWFYVTVAPNNQPPTISGLVNTNMLGNGSGTFAFTIGDDQTPAGSLTLTALSGNSTLVPNDSAHLSFGGSDTNRTLIVTPAAGQYGTVPLTVTVSDGVNNTPLTFVLVVQPNFATLLDEGFDYDTGGALINVSSGFWKTHSGTAAQMQVGSGVVTVTENNGEDVNAPLFGQPYSSSSRQVLYSSFTLNYSSLPSDTGAYFAHFKDATTGGFYGRIFATTHNAAPGFYRLGIGNVAVGNTTAQIEQDLSPGVNYTVVTRLVLSNGVSTIWINPTDESSPGMTDTNKVNAPSPITSYALREAMGEGTLTIDNLKVALNFASVIADVIDVPPQANPDTYSVAQNSTNNVLDPLANDVLNQPQGSLSLVSVSATNGTAVISGTNVLFSPANGFTGVATIGYTITDGFGGTSTSLITVNVTASTPIPLSANFAGGNLVLSWDNPAFSLQFSTNVAGPYVTIPGATSPYTNSVTTNAAGFFRLQN